MTDAKLHDFFYPSFQLLCTSLCSGCHGRNLSWFSVCNGAQWYKQFLQVGQLDRALILLGSALFIFIFILWGGTRSLRMPTLRPASQAGPMHNPREGTSVVLRDTIRLT